MSDHALPRPWVSAAVRSRRRRVAIGLAARYVVLVATIIITIFPLVWLFLTSLRSSADLFAVPVHIIPESATVSQYINIFRQYNLADYVWNTISVSLVTVVCVIVLALPSAYAMARFRLPGQKVVLSLLLIMRMVPVVALAIPLLAVFSRFDMLDTVWALILTHTAAKLPVAIRLLMGFIQDLPKEVEESAQVDGGKHAAHPGADRVSNDSARHWRRRCDHFPVHLERLPHRAHPDLQQGRTDAAGRPYQLRHTVWDR